MSTSSVLGNGLLNDRGSGVRFEEESAQIRNPVVNNNGWAIKSSHCLVGRPMKNADGMLKVQLFNHGLSDMPDKLACNVGFAQMKPLKKTSAEVSATIKVVCWLGLSRF